MGYRTTRAIGSGAEQEAFRYLLGKGLSPVAQNFCCRGGEIDLIMLDDGCLTFIEVRFRSASSFAPPSHTVDYRKQNKIIRTAAMFVARNKRYANYTMRFDVVAVEGIGDRSIHWISDAFRPDNSTL